MRISKNLIGKLVAVKLLDHNLAEGDEGPSEAAVYGRLVKKGCHKGKTFIKVRAWECLDDEPGENNSEFSIMVGEITSITVLTEEKESDD